MDLKEVILIQTKTDSEKAKRDLKEQKEIIRRLTNETNEAARASRAMRTNMLGMGLSFLFTGMAIKRYADNMLKSLYTTYSTIMAEGTLFHEQTNRLSAAFQFLKYSIFDALANSEFFAQLVDWLVQAANWLSEFVAKHPELAKVMLWFLIGASLLGGFLMIVGQTTLGILGLIAMGELLGISFGGIMTFIKGAWHTMIGFLSRTWASFTTWASKVGLGWALFIIAILFLITNEWRKRVGGWGSFFTGVLYGMLIAFGAVADLMVLVMAGLLDVLLAPIKGLLELVNQISSVVGGPKIKMPSLVNAQINNLRSGGGFMNKAIEGWKGTDSFGKWQQGITEAGGPGNFMAAGLSMGLYNPETFNQEAVPTSGAPQTVNNVGTSIGDQTINITVNGANMDSDELIDGIIARLQEEQNLTGGSPQSM